MRSDRHKEALARRKTPFARFTRKFAVLNLILAVGFLLLLFYAELLSMKYCMMAAGAVGFLTLLFFPATFSYKFKKSRKVICFLFSLLLTAGYVLGIVYIGTTLNFFDNITKVEAKTIEYYVIVKDDNRYNKLDDLNGTNIVAYGKGKDYNKAEKSLAKKVQADIAMTDDLSEAVKEIIDEETTSLFLSAIDYNEAVKKHSDLEDETKILDIIKVKVQEKNIAKSVNVTKKSFNVYITGLDTYGDITQTSRSDVNMIVTVNPRTKKVLLTSIPRDYYLEIPDSHGEADKLTHTGIYGASETVGAVEGLLGIDMNYYMKVNYSTLQNLIDGIGGVDVDSDYSFETHGQGSYFVYEQGMNHLNGDEALGFARERKSFTDGDFQRNKNQQKVLTAIIHKMTSDKSILVRYTSLLNSIDNYLETNMSAKEIKSLVRMQTVDESKWKIQRQSLKGEVSPDLMPCYSLGGDYASVVLPDKESVEAGAKRIKEFMKEK